MEYTIATLMGFITLSLASYYLGKIVGEEEGLKKGDKTSILAYLSGKRDGIKWANEQLEKAKVA